MLKLHDRSDCQSQLAELHDEIANLRKQLFCVVDTMALMCDMADVPFPSQEPAPV